jgi:hypothetical protein
MQRNQSSNKRRGFGTREIKALIVALALFISLGFWGVFSRQMFNEAANAAAGLNAPAPTDAAPQPTESLVINFPPLPTVVQYSGSQNNDLQDNPEPASAGFVAQPTAAPVSAATVTGKILLGGAAPQAASQGSGATSSGRKSTVTRTRSSRP